MTGKFQGHNPFSGEKGYVPNFPDRSPEFPGQESRKCSTVSWKPCETRLPESTASHPASLQPGGGNAIISAAEGRDIRIIVVNGRIADRGRLYKTACVLLIVLNIALVVVRYRGAGWDFSTYRAAVKVFQEGRDPYLVKNLLEYSDLGWPFVYPPSTLILFFPVVLLAGIIGYRVLWLLLLAASFFIVRSFDRSFQPFFFATIVTTGFMASYHNFRTGNVGLIELFFFCWTFKFIYEKRYALSAIFINLTAWLKVYPVLLGGLFIFLRKPVRSRIKPLIVLLVAFIVIGSSSLVFFPRLMVSSLGALTGGIDGQHSPADEMSGSSNPSSFLFLKDAGERLFGTAQAVPVVLFLAYAGFIMWCLIRDAQRIERDFTALFSIGTLAILLLLPRLKPYSLTLALIPVYFLMKDMDFRQKLLGLFIVGFLPLGLAAVSFVLRGLDLSSNWIGRQVFFLSGYRQLFSLLAAYVFLRRVRPRKAPPGFMSETARAQF